MYVRIHFSIRKTPCLISCGGANPLFSFNFFTATERSWIELSIAGLAIELAKEVREIWPVQEVPFLGIATSKMAKLRVKLSWRYLCLNGKH